MQGEVAWRRSVACRNELNIAGAAAKALGTDKGFVPITDTAGLLIAYATGTSKSGLGRWQRRWRPYAKALAEELMKPGIEAVTMFRNVQLRVKQTIGQDPWLSFPSLQRSILWTLNRLRT